MRKSVDCPHCKTAQPAGIMVCQNCGSFIHGKPVKHYVSNDGTVLLKDVESSEEERVESGDAWDVLFGVQVLMNPVRRKKYSELEVLASMKLKADIETIGKIGAVKGSTNLIGGAPGAGKSTLSIKMASGLAKTTNRESLYIASEERCEQIKARADRLDIQHQGLIRMVPAMTGATPPIQELVERYNPGAMFLDSVNGISGDNMQDQVTVCNLIKQVCSKAQAVGVILCHVTKGSEIAGVMGLQHAVDATYTFFADESIDGVPRVLHVEKNRNGRAFIDLKFDMTPKGLILRGDDVEEDEEYEDA